MSTIEIHHCPRCDLRFTNTSEVQAHLRDDHDVVLSGQAASLGRDVPATPATAGRIVVPLDPTRPAPVAARVAMTLAHQASMSVELVAAQPPGLDALTTQSYLHRRVRDVADANLPVTCEDLGPDEPADAILAYLEPGGSSLVCMDSQSRGAVGELAFGSVSQAVTRRSPVPVLLCGPDLDPAPLFDRILVGLDGSDLAEQALAVAIEFGATIGATIELLEVLDTDVVLPPDVSEAAYLNRVCASSPVPIEAFDAIHHRDPARALTEAADRPGTILAVGTHGRSGFRRLRTGSVAMDTVRHATCPVLVVPPPTQ